MASSGQQQRHAKTPDLRELGGALDRPTSSSADNKKIPSSPSSSSSSLRGQRQGNVGQPEPAQGRGGGRGRQAGGSREVVVIVDRGGGGGVEHVKRGGVTRCRKQVVGCLMQLARWRRSSAVAKKRAPQRRAGRQEGRSSGGAVHGEREGLDPEPHSEPRPRGARRSGVVGH